MNKSYDVVMDSRKELVNKLIENMEKENSIWTKNWNSRALYPQNPVSEIRYLGGNRVRLMLKAIEKEYKDPRWVTFKQAAENDWKIKKGEKGTLCEKWIFTKKEKEIDENGKEVEKEVRLDKPVVNYFYVFNAEQIENIPELKFNNYTKGVINEITQDFIETSECKIKEVAQGRAYYNPGTDEIVLPTREAFKSQEDFLATTFHEMIHSTGHKDRLNRDLTGGFGSEEYAKEELVAELGSVFLQSRLGIKLEGEHFDNHSAYLKSWINILKNDPNELFRAAAQAEKASEMLHERYIEQLRESAKELSQKEFKPHPLDSFSIHFHYAETGEDTKHLNFDEEEKRYRGVKAYEFIEKVIKFDKEYNEKRELGKDTDYYKSWITINLKGYSTEKIRIDLGDKEFGGYEKVSDALEYRLKEFPKELIEKRDFFAKYLEKTSEEVEKTAKEMLEKIEKGISHFREKEQVYLNEREKIYSEEKTKEEKLSENIKKEILAKKVGIIDLGDSDALEYRLKEFPKELIEKRDFFAKYLEKTPEEVEKTAKEMLEKIEKGISHFREKEQVYLNEREKIYSEEKTKEEKLSENIKKEIKENPNISKEELAKKVGIDDKKLNEELGNLIKNKELFYSNDKGKVRYYTNKTEYAKDIQEEEKQKELAKQEREKELKNLVKEVTQKEIPKDNYNALTGNRVIVENHSSGEKRWMTANDVKEQNIPIKENENSILTITTIEKEGKFYAKPIELYNVSQLNITKEMEQKFVPIKEKIVEKIKDRGIER